MQLIEQYNVKVKWLALDVIFHRMQVHHKYNHLLHTNN